MSETPSVTVEQVIIAGDREVLCASPNPPEVVYGLVDPAEPARVRYIGRTNSPFERYCGHRRSSNRGINRWIFEMEQAGRFPLRVLIERCAPGTGPAREDYWILAYRAESQADLNRLIPPQALGRPTEAV